MQTTPTGLTLDRFCRIMGMNPIHFWGFDLSSLSITAGQGPYCGGAIFQYDWQNAAALSRDSMARSIASAEAELEQLAGYHLVPKYIAQEYSNTTRPSRPEQFNLNSRQLRGFQQSVPASRGYGISGGVRGYTGYGNATITYSNTVPPADFLNLATVAIDIASAPDPCEIAIYYPGHGGEEDWRIQPIRVVQTVQHYVITWEAQMGIVTDALDSYDLANLRGLSATDLNNFIDSVDVGRSYTDISEQALLLWEPQGGCTVDQGWAYSAPGNLWNGWLAQTGVILPRLDPRLGQWAYQAAAYDATTGLWGVANPCCGFREPDMVRMSYYSGYRDMRKACPDLEMDNEWAYIVAGFAASKMERPPCDCAKKFFEYQQQDLAFQGGAEQLSTFQLSPSEIGNPLGTRRGAIMAWRMLSRPGVALGTVAVDGR